MTFLIVVRTPHIPIPLRVLMVLWKIYEELFFIPDEYLTEEELEVKIMNQHPY